MKKILVLVAFSMSLSFGFNLESFAKSVMTDHSTSTAGVTKSSTSSLSNATISNGLKEALKRGVTYTTQSLGKENGYLKNALVKIVLPPNLQKAEEVVRKLGGGKVADDLIDSMNAAASKAAPKTTNILLGAITKMNLHDVQGILTGGNNAATEYFKAHTSSDLEKMIAPIVKASMKQNNVAKYYDQFNQYYQTYGKKYVENSDVLSFAKKLGVDSYLPSESKKTLDTYVTQEAISGLFKMIAKKEADIRENPKEQTTALLREVFGKQ